MDETEKPTDIDRRIALDARDWIVRLTSGNVSKDDLDRFKAWRNLSPDHKRAFEQERMFWQQLQVLDGRSDGMPPFLQRQPMRRRAIGRRAFLVGGGAAATAAAAAIAVPRLELWWKADFSTGIGEQAEFDLPDGSVASLNTDSAISIDYRSDIRLVELLKGEAEFRVRPDSSFFRVAALGGNSDALGTRFSVKALEDTATVTVSEGHVRVAGPAAPREVGEMSIASVDLLANNQTHYIAGERPSAPTAVDTDTVLAWRNGRVIFEGRPFGSAVAELGRYMPERIMLAPGINASVPVSAVFSTKEALSAVQALARTQGLTARRIPGVVILIS